MHKEELIRIFTEAIDLNYNFVAVKIEMEGFKRPEVIVNKLENAEDKLSYYINTYDENLIHKFSNKEIKIIDATYGSSYSDIGFNIGEENRW